ncbi:MAG TPA: molybdenum cofactor guanylyltransferase [Thermodesulfobacteriota bacterium]|nr:molybdenum cofactor guanylyltransferase [Thermodesulfobacteriota bacterium]
MTGVILAGGESTRMGKNKAFIEINGKRIIDRTVSLFREIFDDVLLVTNTPLDYIELKVRIVTDLVPGKGSLGGIYTGIFFASSPKAFFAGCDMPFLDRRVIQYFLSLAQTADIVVQRTKDYWQPLHAIYPRTLLKPIERLLQQGELTIFKAYQGLRVREVTGEELKPFDPDLHTLSNINTPEELKKLLETHPNTPL